MTSYHGIITIGEIKNNAPASYSEGEAAGMIALGKSNLRFVHYPDCQQLIIWLTHPGREYGNLRLRNRQTNEIMEQWGVTERLSGSIQILWDTLPVPPGRYSIEIDWKNGWQHEISIEKLEENVLPLAEEPVVNVTAKEEEPTGPIVYRDGFGNRLENEDLVLREKLTREIAGKFSRRIAYEGNFRAGTIIYTDAAVRIAFPHEMGGGNCMFYIEIPTETHWEAQTKTALADRGGILEFVALTVQAEQASNCNYIIKTDTISFYYK